MRRLLLALVAVGGLSVPPRSARAEEAGVAPAPRETTSDGVRRIADVEYGRVGDTRLLLDLYLPERAEGPLPVVLWVHGGAWVTGTKAFCPILRLVPKGYAVASVGYRLATTATFPAQLDDVRAAVRWLRTHAKEHGLDPARIGAAGASAGGHLVALLGTVPNPAKPGEPSSRVQAVIDLFGPTDLVALAERAAEKGVPTPIDTLLGGPVADNMAKARDASPLTHVTKDDAPFLILHGDRDWLVPVEQSEQLVRALEKAGVEATLHVIEGRGHGFLGPKVDPLILEFLDRHLKTKRPSEPDPKGAGEAKAPKTETKPEATPVR